MKLNRRLIWLIYMLQFFFAGVLGYSLLLLNFGFLLSYQEGFDRFLHLLSIFQLIIGIAGVLTIKYSTVQSTIIGFLMLTCFITTISWQIDVSCEYGRIQKVIYLLPVFSSITLCIWILRILVIKGVINNFLLQSNDRD